MIRLLLVAHLWAIYAGLPVSAQTGLEGQVLSTSGQRLSGAGLRLKYAGAVTKADERGYFRMLTPSIPDTLIVAFLGYRSKRIPVGQQINRPLLIELESDNNTLQEVEVSTGFYQVPKERATGSFTQVDNELLNRAVSGSILQRLEGIASGVQFKNANGTTAGDIRVRGLATIQSDETPLIVVDNFPYEGNISNINPNDVLSVTVLKDAAAASIWGARAGNGVIVITTKSGQYNQKPRISLNSNVTMGEKPDLFYNQSRLPSAIVMDIEKEKYERGGYYLPDANQTPFPAYVELLIQKDRGEISETDFRAQETLMKNTEVRNEALKYLYQPSVYQQYAVNATGGSPVHNYYFSAAYDKSRSNVIGNNSNRLNLGLQNTFRLFKGMELSAEGWYTQQQGQNNGLGLNDLKAGGTNVGLSSYIRLADEQGNHLPIVREYRKTYVDTAASAGLLDWQYRPLDEVSMANNQSRSTEIRLNAGLKYSFLAHFNVNATYQYSRSNSGSSNLYSKDSYYVRNIVNRFTDHGTFVIPNAAIYNENSPTEAASHSGRVQLNYNQPFRGDHQVSALAGAEIRQYIQNISPGYRLFNYDPELLLGTTYYDYTKYYPNNPSGVATIPQPYYVRTRYTDRYLSYFANASYTYKERYILSGSARWDGSNLFGVKTNQKGTPLWSVGGSWEVSKEPFYKLGWLPYLRLRSTYGSSGNVNKNVSVYPTISYANASVTQFPAARVTSAGNPSLRWEQVNTVNLGLDFGTKDRRLSGSVEYYSKDAKDLIGADYLAPSTGIITGGTATNTNLINYANLRTQGWDVQLESRNLIGELQWQSILLLNLVKNKVTNFNTAKVNIIGNYATSPAPPGVGKSRDVIYALPWYGLDHDSGMPIIYLDGALSTDYATYYQTYQAEDLVTSGVSVPPFYGSLRNELSWKGITASILLTWETGSVFRRRSIGPGDEYNDPYNYHLDYLKRWQHPGDEAHTDVPAWAESFDTYRTQAYVFSEALITKGDQIRLQDINLSYSISKRYLEHLPLQSLKIYGYARNLGILWRVNKNNIDPDYATAEYPAVRTFAVGLQASF